MEREPEANAPDAPKQPLGLGTGDSIDETIGLPARLTNPAPVIAAGIALWVVATAVVLVVGERWESALPTCLAGIGVGTVGFLLFVVQRTAARRGRKTAQRGLL